MKRYLIKALFLPLLLLWVVIVPLFRLLNRFYPAPVWGWQGVYLINARKSIKFRIKDSTEGSEIVGEVYWNSAAAKRFIHIVATNDEVDRRVYINTKISNLEML